MRIFAFADEASPEFPQQILAMQRNGLQGVELRRAFGCMPNKLSLADAKEVRRQMDTAGLEVWSIGSPIGKIDIETGDYAAHLEDFKHTLEVAHVTGAKNVRLFSFFIPKGKEPQLYKNEVIDRLGQMLEIAKGSGVDLCHENEKGIYGEDAPRCLELLQALPNLKGIFDPANFVQCGQETKAAWQMLAPYIKYLHIKDALADGMVVPAGKGIGNLPYILSEFKKQGGNELTIEPHLTVFKGLADLERKGEETKTGLYQYPDSNTAFDAACDALKKIL